VLTLILPGQLKWFIGNQLAMELEQIINLYREVLLLGSCPSVMPMLFAWLYIYIYAYWAWCELVQ